ncbi:MAG: carbohydrate kinase [Rhodoglobus sp.]|nr:carbohydrate kinase [Rhodoglobus sp.]
MNPPEPIVLPSNQPRDRFYQGGSRISDFRSEPPSDPRTPEDWVGSTTSVRGAAPVGMTRLPDGRLLVEALEAAPIEWLGPEHVERFGADAKLLVKLLDAGQRLPIHAHPDGEFAARHVGARHGKAEAWYILSPGTVFLGLKEDVDDARLLALVEGQHASELLALMHEIDVRINDTVYVPPGVLHAIGEGILLAEVQEPEDLSILLEWEGYDLDGARDGHLGLGFELALNAVETRGRSRDEALALVRAAADDGPALVPEADRYFRLDRVSTEGDFPAGLAVVIGLDGELSLGTANGAVPLRRGTTVLVPYSAGGMRLTGAGTALVARPPLA